MTSSPRQNTIKACDLILCISIRCIIIKIYTTTYSGYQDMPTLQSSPDEWVIKNFCILPDNFTTSSRNKHIFFPIFFQCNRLMRWCSAPNCSNAVRVSHIEPKPVKCVCGHTFCFACSENWHDPVRCHLIKKWIKKCDDDSETSNWISANTKECPTCGATIGKQMND